MFVVGENFGMNRGSVKVTYGPGTGFEIECAFQNWLSDSAYVCWTDGEANVVQDGIDYLVQISWGPFDDKTNRLARTANAAVKFRALSKLVQFIKQLPSKFSLYLLLT